MGPKYDRLKSANIPPEMVLSNKHPRLCSRLPGKLRQISAMHDEYRKVMLSLVAASTMLLEERVLRLEGV